MEQLDEVKIDAVELKQRLETLRQSNEALREDFVELMNRVETLIFMVKLAMSVAAALLIALLTLGVYTAFTVRVGWSSS